LLTVTGGSGDKTVGAALTVTAFTAATADTDSSDVKAIKYTTMAAASDITINDVAFSFGVTDTVQDVLDTINSAGIGVTASHTDGAAIVLTSNQVGSAADMTIGGLGAGDFTASSVTQGVDASITAGVSTSAQGNVVTIESGAAKGLEITVSGSEVTAGGDETITVTANGGLNMQIGANEGQDMYVSINDMRSSALGVDGVDITSATSAKAAITTINDAITSVSTERAKLGAVQNRLEHTIKNLDTSAENLQASESRIRDVDMAKEMMNFTKNNILQQAAQAMLAQANQAPQGVLQLLR
jgi:flagellin